MSLAELDTLARTVWGEARGEGYLGMHAVARVIVNRAKRAAAHKTKYGSNHRLFGDGSLSKACLAPKQFSAWNEGDPNRGKMLAVTLEDRAFRYALRASLDALIDDTADPTAGGDHYFTIARPSWATVWPPPWAASMTHTADFGNHRFYRS